MWWLILLFLLLKHPTLALEATPSATVLINKFQYNPPLDKNEWVELYNTTDAEIDLDSWQLVDESNTKKLLTGKKIAAKSTLLLEDGKSWLNNTAANNDGDTIFLKIGDSIIDEVDYKRVDGKILVKGVDVPTADLILKGKWIGRTIDGSDNWQMFADTSPPTGGAISYFNGYKTVVGNIGVSITPASDPSGIGITTIIIKEGLLESNQCNNFVNLAIGNSLSDGRCYKFEYMATDGVGNTEIFGSDSIVKFDTSKPEITVNNAFRNILQLKSEFKAIDWQSGILGYKYGLNDMKCDQYIDNNVWYTGSDILSIGYSGNPLSIVGKSINNAGLESDVGCLDFIIDLTTPQISNQINPEKGRYKIGDRLEFKTEFNENIDLVGNNFKIKLNTGEAKLTNKDGHILRFEYQVKEGDLTDNLEIGETNILLNGGGVFDLAGNAAELKINNLELGIEIDGVTPLVSLIGETYVEIPQFGNYLDLGVTVSDGEITSENKVNTMLGGTYEVEYTVTDEAGNKSFAIRKVIVVDTTAPTVTQLSVTSYAVPAGRQELSVKSNEEGYLEWKGKCQGVDNDLVTGDNLIKIKNSGDGVYDNCEVRAWDKWGNIGSWQKIDSFVIDTTPPLLEFDLPTPDNNSFTKNSEIEVVIKANEKLKECSIEKEKLVSGDFESGKIDEWTTDSELPWIADQIHFASGAWSARSPSLKDQDLIEKSIEQKVKMERDGVLSFWWRVSSEPDWDYLKLYIDGVLVNKISGEVAWQEQKHNLNSGDHAIRFIYSKDYSGEAGEDAGWIDEVKVNGGGEITTMTVVDQRALTKIVDLEGGVTKYKASCSDLYNNKTVSEERKIIKEVDKLTKEIELLPTAYTIFKTSAIVPTLKPTKVMVTKSPTKIPIKKAATILGVATTPTAGSKNIAPLGKKLSQKIDWGEIRFWTLGFVVLGTTTGVIILDRKND